MSMIRIRTRHRAIAVVLTLSVLLAALAACAPPSEPPPSPTPTATPEPTASPTPDQPAEEHNVLVYLVRGERLGVAARSVSDTAGIAAAAMRALLSGATSEDTDAGLDTQIPAGTVLNGVRIEGGGAVVDLSEDFESGGGAASMQLRVAQVVYTLTQFSSVENVSFEIDGRPVDAIGGEGVVVSPAVDRDDFEENVLPPIFVESPTPFLEVGDSFRLSGRSNTFEATFVYNVLDAGGKVVKRDFVTATAGSGTWGSFDVFVPLEAISPGNGSLVVFEESAEDGSRINAVRIPIRLVR